MRTHTSLNYDGSCFHCLCSLGEIAPTNTFYYTKQHLVFVYVQLFQIRLHLHKESCMNQWHRISSGQTVFNHPTKHIITMKVVLLIAVAAAAARLDLIHSS